PQCCEAGGKRPPPPTLIIWGDEDEPCLQPSLYLKRVLPNAGLALFAKTGHTVNLEEPDAFNREVWNFITLAEAGKWPPRPAEGPGGEPDLIFAGGAALESRAPSEDHEQVGRSRSGKNGAAFE